MCYTPLPTPHSFIHTHTHTHTHTPTHTPTHTHTYTHTHIHTHPHTPTQVVVSFWRNGFSVDNGEDTPTLRSLLDPANKLFLHAIQQGQIPDELLSMGEEIDLEMQDHRDEEFVPPKPKLKPFTGAGHTLGGSAGAGAGSGGSATDAAAASGAGAGAGAAVPRARVSVMLCV